MGVVVHEWVFEKRWVGFCAGKGHPWSHQVKLWVQPGKKAEGQPYLVERGCVECRRTLRRQLPEITPKSRVNPPPK